MRKITATPAELLRAKLELQANGCIEWTGARQWMGHGSVHVGGGVKVAAHRLAWELEHGPIPEGMCVLHGCDNPPCCNVNHLHLGTRADNNREKAERGRSTKGRVVAECKVGHPLIEGNVIVKRNGDRQCKPCTYQRNAEWLRNRKQQMAAVQ